MANLTVESNFNLSMEEMTTKTPGHCEQWNKRHRQLLNNDKYLKEQVDNMLQSVAGAHNAIYRGKNLGECYSIDQICTMISNGTFIDIFIGDYFDVSINTAIGGTETVRCVIADLDTFMQNGSIEETGITKHHAVIVPKDCFKTTAKMNDTSVTTSGCRNSNMFKSVLPVYSEALQSALNNHIIKYDSFLSSSASTIEISNVGQVKNAYANSHQWTNVTLNLMSEIQLFGSTILSSYYDIGEKNTQFSLFRHNPAMKIAGAGHGGKRVTYWLGAVATSSSFVCCGNFGNISHAKASIEACCVRPYFLIG